MNADSTFTIGSTHSTCQDYATHQNDEITSLIVVCDGCSSSPKTDVGARILAETFAGQLPHFTSNESLLLKEFHIVFKANVRTLNNTLRLAPACFDSTLLACLVDQGTQMATLFLWGDGHLRIQHTSGEATTLDINFQTNQNAPFYPSYEIFNFNGRKDYETQFGQLVPSRIWTSNVLPLPEFALEYPIFQIPIKGISAISLFSDGASSFLQGENNEGIPPEFITTQLCDFKSLEGDFLKRRVKKCQKLWHKESIQHADDLGVASILLTKT
jgi:hypothetical protein